MSLDERNGAGHHLPKSQPTSLTQRIPPRSRGYCAERMSESALGGEFAREVHSSGLVVQEVLRPLTLEF